MWQFRDVDLAAVAKAMGCHAERVTRPADIRPALERALAADRVAVVDIASDLHILAPPPWS
jgi:thiamine pyrophosphate-dependent acetolactate synthase large subunit-like protein